MTARVAQLAEPRTCNADVPGSNPGAGSIYRYLWALLARVWSVPPERADEKGGVRKMPFATTVAAATAAWELIKSMLTFFRKKPPADPTATAPITPGAVPPENYRPRPKADIVAPAAAGAITLAMWLLASCAGAPALPDTQALKAICESVVPCEPCPACSPSATPAPVIIIPPAVDADDPPDAVAPDGDADGESDAGDATQTEADPNKKGDGLHYELHRPADCDRSAGKIVMGLKQKKSACGGKINRTGNWTWAARGGTIDGGQYYISRHSVPPPTGKETISWAPTAKGTFKVWVGWRCSPNRARKVPYSLVLAGGKKVSFTVNQRVPSDQLLVQWALLGQFDLDEASVLTLFNGPDHSESADGAAFLRVGP